MCILWAVGELWKTLHEIPLFSTGLSTPKIPAPSGKIPLFHSSYTPYYYDYEVL